MPHHCDALTGTAELQLLGWWELRVEGSSTALGRREERLISLLALLGRTARPKVAGLLWPESSDDHAMTNLRAAIWRTRRTVGGVLGADRTTLWIESDVAIDVDRVGRYASGVASTPDSHLLGDVARGLDGGDLLPGWYEDWVIYAREHLDHLRFRAFEAMAWSLLEAGRPDDAARAARSALTIEPLHDATNRVLISANLACGSTAEAVRHFHEYRALLHRELGVQPSRRIYELIAPLLIPRPRKPSVSSRPWRA